MYVRWPNINVAFVLVHIIIISNDGELMWV